MKKKLDNVRMLKGICFVDAEDEEFHETIKIARKKLEVLMEAAVLCKMATRKRAWKLRETVASANSNLRKKTKYACIVEAHESTRKRLESTLPRNHDDHIAEKGFNSITHYNLVRTFIAMPQAMKFPDSKASVDKEWKKARSESSLAVGQSEQ